LENRKAKQEVEAKRSWRESAFETDLSTEVAMKKSENVRFSGLCESMAAVLRGEMNGNQRIERPRYGSAKQKCELGKTFSNDEDKW
jgi:hypothetical protein